MDSVHQLRLALKEAEKEAHLHQCKRLRKLIILRLEMWSVLINPKLEMSSGTLLQELKHLGWDLYDLSDYLAWRNRNPKDEESSMNGNFYESTQQHLFQTIDGKMKRLKLEIIKDGCSNLKNIFIEMLCIFIYLKNPPEGSNKSKTEIIGVLSKILNEEGKGHENFVDAAEDESFDILAETKSAPLDEQLDVSKVQEDENFLNSLNATRSAFVRYIDHLLALTRDGEKNLIHCIFHLKWGKKILVEISELIMNAQNEEIFQDKVRNYYHMDLIVTKLLQVFRQIDGNPEISVIWSQNCSEEEATRCASKLGELRNLLKDEEA